MLTNTPIRLSPARAWRTYTGGKLIDQLHGIQGAMDNHFPEEWIISTVVARNTNREKYVNEGLSFSTDENRSLADLINENPSAMLGERHLKTVGQKTGVLVKLIDSAERLTIQVHPDKVTAGRLFQSEFGKTECWHILNTRTINGEEPVIYLGFKPGVTREYWQHVFNTQDIPAMLNCLHKFPVKNGDTFLILGGVPHAIGSGCLLIEIQEPTDYSIRTERITPTGFEISDYMCHQGIGFDNMFDCFSYEGESAEDTYSRYHIIPRQKNTSNRCFQHELVGYNDTPCFMLESYKVDGTVVMPKNDTFYGLYIFKGKGTLKTISGIENVKAGDQYFVPASADSFELTSCGQDPMSFFCCFGPQTKTPNI